MLNSVFANLLCYARNIRYAIQWKLDNEEEKHEVSVTFVGTIELPSLMPYVPKERTRTTATEKGEPADVTRLSCKSILASDIFGMLPDIPLRLVGSDSPRESYEPISKFPVFIGRFDCPFEFLSKSFGEESFNRNIELLREDNGQARVNVVLPMLVAEIV